ncbi:cysteine desulfurase [Gardnerella sp. DNF01162]|uniref:SufS family cysteine desulfurase n=1 Tax=Gardnerella TaxID=2701 RepID=UPI000CAFADF3|nr:SufS family cysteine desulfurase [Gardnerella sp. DNF01162]PNP90898.1 cysteine desulfurase [Gardnerella sp. DNF01162]RFD73741.1 cysteine desulfurase [Gardnerella vaginalis]
MREFSDLRSQFPILSRTVHGTSLYDTVHGKPLIYLDSAATSQKPQVVIDAEKEFYETINAGVHRGAHELAALSTVAFEEARAKVARLVGACADAGREEIVVTPGATGALNLLATAIGNASAKARICKKDSSDSVSSKRDFRQNFVLREGDVIVVSRADHHSVLLPFQELALRTGAELRWIDVTEDGRVRTDTDYLRTIIDERTKIVAVTHISNVTGAITDVSPICKRAHEVGAIFVLDACQSVPHIPVDLRALDVDFAAFSAHKMYGPTGVGFLYGRRELLNALPPANFGGSMVELAWLNKPAQYMDAPYRFEAGTQPVAQMVAAGVAADWLRAVGMNKVAEHEQEIAAELLKLRDVPGVRILGPTDLENRIGTVAFEVEGVHPHDVGQFLDAQGIAIRVGHHCAQPIHRHFGVYASNRASVGVYNTVDEARAFVEAVSHVRAYFGA